MDVHALKIDRTKAAKPTRRSGGWLGKVIALAVVAGLVWFFWKPLTQAVDNVRLPGVRVMRVTESHPAAAGAVAGTAANGHVVAARRAALSADTPGRIVEMNVTEGSFVAQGDVVARLYADEYAAALRAAEAELEAAAARAKRAEAGILSARADLEQSQKNVEAAQEDIAEARANLALAKEEFDRAKDLLARGDSSQANYDSAKAGLDATSAKVRASEARLRAAEAAATSANSRVVVAEVELEAARAEVVARAASRDLAAATLDKTEVRAPFDGIVVLKDAEVGEVVSPNSQGGSNARGSVCTLVDLDSLEAQAEVPESSLSAVVLGEPASIFLDAYPSVAYSGRVDRIWPTADRQKATVEVRIKFDAPDERLRPEMGLRIVFAAATPSEQQSAEPAILIPIGAVIEQDGARGVFVLERDVVRFARVQLGDERGGRVVVSSGLEPGQRIVLDPPAGLGSEDRVRINQS